MTPSRHLYVHVPFCDGKCVYCAFYSEPYAPARADLYLAALAGELAAHARGRGALRPETIYLGGGTPSILSAAQLAALGRLLATRADLSRLREWTVEGNPGTFSPAKVRALKAAGVTRVSLGAQSLDGGVLKAMGRRHSADQVVRTVAALRRHGIGHIGLDLIAGWPGLDESRWARTLDRALAAGPDHVSVYLLTIEPDSRLGRSAVNPPAQDAGGAGETRALQLAARRLAAAGFEHYEISNYARAGSRCLHNLSCWHGEDYLGLGPGASSRAGRRRWTNRPDLSAYAAALARGRPPPREEEALTREQDLAERLVFAFRVREGVDLDAFCARRRVPRALRAGWEATLDRLRVAGAVEIRGARRRLTARGRRLADAVARDLLPDADGNRRAAVVRA